MVELMLWDVTVSSFTPNFSSIIWLSASRSSSSKVRVLIVICVVPSTLFVWISLSPVISDTSGTISLSISGIL